MELLWLKYFCDAARTENLSETARHFLVPPSNISQTVKKLERELGVELFERKSNRLSLSRSGRIYYERLKCALEMLEEAEKALADSQDSVAGEIRMKVSTNRRIVTRAIESFVEKYPSVTFKIRHESGSAEDFDLIITDAPLPLDRYERKLLIKEQILLAMSGSSPLGEKKEISVADLRGESFITMHEGSSMHSIAKRICSESGFEPGISIYTDDPFYIRKYVEMGLGIAFVPAFSWKGQFPSGVLLRSIGDISRKTYLYRPKSRYTSRSVRLFEEALLSAARKESEEK